MRISIPTLMVILALGGAAPASAQDGPPIFGYRVVLKPIDGSDSKGELIAVTPDSLWLLHRNALSVFPLANMKEVKIQESSFGAGKVAIWSLIVAGISGVALTAACSSVDADCASVLPSTLASWAFIGGIAMLAVEPSRYREFSAPTADQLRPYSRFPQGIPGGFQPEDPPGDSPGSVEEGGGGRR